MKNKSRNNIQGKLLLEGKNTISSWFIFELEATGTLKKHTSHQQQSKYRHRDPIFIQLTQ